MFGHGEPIEPPPHLPNDPPGPTPEGNPQLDLDVTSEEENRDGDGDGGGDGDNKDESDEADQSEDEGSEVLRLVSAVESLTARYEMEMSAHRHTAEQLIQQQQAHIASLQQLIEELTSRLHHNQQN